MIRQAPQFLSRAVDALRPPWVWRGEGEGGGMPASLRFWADGGLALSEPLPRQGVAAPPHLGLVLQPDGDVLLLLPSGFGSEATDADAARALFRKARRELAAVARGPLPTAVAAAFLVVDALLVLGGGLPLIHEAVEFWRTGAKPDVLPILAPPALAIGRPFAGRFIRSRLIDWFMRRGRAEIAAAR